MVNEVFVVVAYDIASDRRRNRLVKFLKDYGVRVNYSVFECEIQKKYFSEFKKGVDEIINTKEDIVIFYRMCKKCRISKEAEGLVYMERSERIVVA